MYMRTQRALAVGVSAERRQYNQDYFNGDVKGWNDCLKNIIEGTL